MTERHEVCGVCVYVCVRVRVCKCVRVCFTVHFTHGTAPFSNQACTLCVFENSPLCTKQNTNLYPQP
jgi:hypothetical protein